MRTHPLSIERLTFGPDALARLDGRIVFVAGAAPGDRVLAELTRVHRGVLRARVAQVVTPGPSRVEPRCPWIDRCGGCPWQHIAAAAQQEAKRAVVAEQIARLGGLRDVAVAPTLAAPDPWRYRSRITLATAGRRLGYHGRGSHRLVAIDDCLIAEPILVTHLPVARQWLAELRTVPRRVTLAVGHRGVVIHGHGGPAPSDDDDQTSARLLARSPTVQGVILSGGGQRHVVGDPMLHVPLEAGCELVVPADAFTQVHPAANRLVVRTVLELSALAAGDRALDLYCGAGNFALPLARRGVSVTGIERSAIATAAASANARRLGVSFAVVTGDVATVLATLPRAPLDCVVLDPPRGGAADAVPMLAAHRPSRIVYVSCDPATFARDARHLVALGWRLGRVQPIDVFPHTHHVEIVAEFRC